MFRTALTLFFISTAAVLGAAAGCSPERNYKQHPEAAAGLGASGAPFGSAGKPNVTSGGGAGKQGDAGKSSGGMSAAGGSGNGGSSSAGAGADSNSAGSTSGGSAGSADPGSTGGTAGDANVTPTTSPNGSPCSDPSECASAKCADGVCCDTACDGQCESCKTDGAVGTCTAIIGAPVAPRAACSGTGGCGGQCDGVDPKSCTYPGDTKVCTPATCEDGEISTASVCNGSGSCTEATASSCETNLCATDSPGKCATSCTSGSCGADKYCDTTGACVATRSPGQSCSDKVQCASGNCVDGVCCSSACTGSCQVCNASGACVRKTSGAPASSHPACITSDPTCGGTCDGSSDACVYPGTSKKCGSATCSADLATVNSMACNGQGACTTPQSSGCGTSSYCSGGACASKIANGSACQVNGQCTSANCSTYPLTGNSLCCQSGYSDCGSCVNVQSNDSNCGACSNACAANRSCQTGSCRCSGYAFPTACGTCGSFSFESGTVEGWVKDTDPNWPVNGGGSNNGVTNITTTQSRVHDGSYALAVPGNANGQIISVTIPLCNTSATINVAGFTMSAWVYITGTALDGYAFMFFDAWNSTTSTNSPVLTGDKIAAINTWYHVQTTFSSTVQADHVAIRLNPEQAWTGTVYIDSVEITGP